MKLGIYLLAMTAHVAVLVSATATAQDDPFTFWTLLPEEQMDWIIGEASGETAYNTILETGGYNKDRLADEYADTFYETEYIYDQLNRYGLPGAEIVRFLPGPDAWDGPDVWDGIKGELWEIDPNRQKLASYRDMTAMLACGSQPADVKAQLVWVGYGTAPEINHRDTTGKIVVTEGYLPHVYELACAKGKALGVIAIHRRREHLDPTQIPFYTRRLRSERKGRYGGGFAFFMTARDGAFLKERLLYGETITVHAQVDAEIVPFEYQDLVCHIPGTDRGAESIILSAHLFEGIVKQGANDNKSGSAVILEVARILHTLIEDGRLPRPRRTIRFLWGPEFGGTGPWVKANKELMENTLCNINMDMVGEWLSKHKAVISLISTSYGNAHYVNDVTENYYRYVGETSRQRLHGWKSGYGVPRRIVAPTGADEPFHYSIEVHYGNSDHEVFNDWGVQVPGVMMIAWPDPWSHTSGDRINKCDPTQLKRAAVIGAAAAYTIASADDDTAMRIAGETAANASRRLAHQFMRGQEQLNRANTEELYHAYRLAQLYIRAGLTRELETLQSVLELADEEAEVAAHIEEMKAAVTAVAKALQRALEAHMRQRACQLGIAPVEVLPTNLEEQASCMVPIPTAKVKANGYRGYVESIEAVPKELHDKFPVGRDGIASTRELHLLIDGRHTVLEIRDLLDAQFPQTSDLQSIINYIKILESAGLIEWAETGQ